MKKKIGILVTHGTDTLSWGLDIIKYMLKNLPCPVVLTGAQTPMQIAFSASDGYDNLKSAVLLLCYLKQNAITMVFDQGFKVFRSNVIKYDKWQRDAFFGNTIGKIEWNEISLNKFKLHENLVPLDILHIVRTGGTIESEKNKNGALSPTGDFVTSFVSANLVDYFKDLSTHSLFAKDSSEITPEDWCKIADKIYEITRTVSKKCKIDKKFDWNVNIVYANPFYRSDYYKTLLKDVKQGLVIAGYGAGNLNVRKDCNYSVLGMIKDAQKEKKIVVLSSQVIKGISDIEYESSRIAILHGAIPSCELNPIASQIKLAFILGHKLEIEKTAKKHKLDDFVLTKAAFLAGNIFRSKKSQKKFEDLTKIPIYPKNIFLCEPFEKAIEKVAEFVRDNIYGNKF